MPHAPPSLSMFDDTNICCALKLYCGNERAENDTCCGLVVGENRPVKSVYLMPECEDWMMEKIN